MGISDFTVIYSLPNKVNSPLVRRMTSALQPSMCRAKQAECPCGRLTVPRLLSYNPLAEQPLYLDALKPARRPETYLPEFKRYPLFDLGSFLLNNFGFLSPQLFLCQKTKTNLRRGQLTALSEHQE